MSKFFTKLLILVFLPVSFAAAQYNSGYDDGYSEGYNDGYVDTQYEAGSYVDSDNWDASSSSKRSGIFHMSLALRGGWQGVLVPVQEETEDEFISSTSLVSGFMGEALLNIDISYLYLQVGLGWSSGWSNNWEKPVAEEDEGKKNRAGEEEVLDATNSGLYILAGGGLVLPNGLRIGAGVQIATDIFSVGEDEDPMKKMALYAEISYEFAINKNLYFTAGIRGTFPGLFAASATDDELSKKIRATETETNTDTESSSAPIGIEVMVGISYYFF